jgi:hypothetical protein
MPYSRRKRCSLVGALLLAGTCAGAIGLGSSDAAAAPTKVACVGEQTTHSDQLSRTVEYPVMLQNMLGACYVVQNFGDCCATVLQGYPMQPETHPYLNPPARFSPAFHESVTFAPDVVVIGSWGKHDTEIANSLYAGKLDPVKWQADYEQLVTTYVNLPNKPTVYVSTPLPLPMGAGTGPTTDVILPAIQNIAAKYHLAIVPLYAAFLNQPQLYKDATHPTNDAGLKKIAETVYATMMATMGSCSDGGLLPPSGDGGGSSDATAPSGSPAGSGSTAGSGAVGGGDGSTPGVDPSAADGGTGGASTGPRGVSGGPSTAQPSGCACGVASRSGRGAPATGLLAALVGCVLTRRRKSTRRSRQAPRGIAVVR